MKAFYLHRHVDVSGKSGTGIVAEGVEFDNGKCVLTWLTGISSVAVYDSFADMENVHGHDGKTRAVPVWDSAKP
jgi:hypothetical protein